ncbi:MAG: hypothetical protein VR78_02990 [Hoeflea sp. BRH_c9]|nr:MAG: hypothetical protein VR78_02990 [Hoeflea sp. BRH_c9]
MGTIHFGQATSAKTIAEVRGKRIGPVDVEPYGQKKTNKTKGLGWLGETGTMLSHKLALWL